MSPKRKALTVEQKFDIISLLEKGATNSDVCKGLQLKSSTVSTIWKNREKIKQDFETDKAHTKKHRGKQFEDVDEALITWFKVHRSAPNNIPINGPILLKQARKFAAHLGYESAPDSSWLQRFRNRHNIFLGKTGGEASSVLSETKEEWFETVWPKIRDGYFDDQIFNADEFGLLYKLSPDNTFRLQEEKCFGGKMPKSRITAIVAANMTGTEKKKLLVIGRWKNPRCFRNINVQRLGADYTFSRKALMTSKIFEEFLRNWDEELRKKEKKILLVVDSSPAHPRLKNLQQIKVVFLPPNITSIMQPMDQGVIKDLKGKFRKNLLLRIIRDLEEKEATTITVLDAVRMLTRAWDDVSERIIRNCFRHAGWQPVKEEAIQDLADEEAASYVADEDINEWARNLNEPESLRIDVFNEYVSMDDNLTVTSAMTDDDIILSVRKDRNEVEAEEDQSDDEEPLASVSFSDACKGLALVRRYLQENEVPSDVDAAVISIENHMDSIFMAQRRKQLKVNDFFSSEAKL